MPEEWKKPIIVPIYRKGGKTDCSNYRGISLLSTAYTILSNIRLSRLTPYAEEVIGDHQCGFRRSRSIADRILCIRQILEKKWEFNDSISGVLWSPKVQCRVPCSMFLAPCSEPDESSLSLHFYPPVNVMVFQ